LKKLSHHGSVELRQLTQLKIFQCNKIKSTIIISALFCFCPRHCEAITLVFKLLAVRVQPNQDIDMHTLLRSSYVFFLVVFMAFGLPLSRLTHAAQQHENFVLYHSQGKMLRDSKWGKIPAWQTALNAALLACGKAGIGAADGMYGKGSQQGLMALLSCPAYRDLAIEVEDPLYGKVTSILWSRLLPDTALPSTHERAFALSLTHEATDYDRVEWNYQTADDLSALTWGPYGATVGWGNEVRSILIHLFQGHAEFVTATFGAEFASVEQLMTAEAKQGYALLKPIFADIERRAAWKHSLQLLGASEVGIQAYNWFAFDSGQWMSQNLQRLYALIPDADKQATEADYGFFLDLAMHAGVSSKRIAEAQQALEVKQTSLGRPLTSAERRREIANVWAEQVNARWRDDRVARNVVFYVDGIGEGQLSEQERQAWLKRTGLKASYFGLSDTRHYYPSF